MIEEYIIIWGEINRNGITFWQSDIDLRSTYRKQEENKNTGIDGLYVVLNQPRGIVVCLADVCALLEIEEDDFGVKVKQLDILNTEKGKILDSLKKSGCRLYLHVNIHPNITTVEPPEKPFRIVNIWIDSKPEYDARSMAKIIRNSRKRKLDRIRNVYTD